MMGQGQGCGRQGGLWALMAWPVATVSSKTGIGQVANCGQLELEGGYPPVVRVLHVALLPMAPRLAGQLPLKGLVWGYRLGQSVLSVMRWASEL